MSHGQSSHCTVLTQCLRWGHVFASILGQGARRQPSKPGSPALRSARPSKPACGRTHAHPPSEPRPLAMHGVPNNRRCEGTSGKVSAQVSGAVRQPLEREHPAPVSPSGLSSLCPHPPRRAREHPAPTRVGPADTYGSSYPMKLTDRASFLAVAPQTGPGPASQGRRVTRDREGESAVRVGHGGEQSLVLGPQPSWKDRPLFPAPGAAVLPADPDTSACPPSLPRHSWLSLVTKEKEGPFTPRRVGEGTCWLLELSFPGGVSESKVGMRVEFFSKTTDLSGQLGGKPGPGV